MPIGVQLRPCYEATAESLRALVYSWRGGTLSSGVFLLCSFFAGVSKSRFLRYRCALSPRPLAARLRSACQALMPKLLSEPPSTARSGHAAAGGVLASRLLLTQSAGCVAASCSLAIFISTGAMLDFFCLPKQRASAGLSLS